MSGKSFKEIFKHKNSLAWFIVTAVLVVVLIVSNIVIEYYSNIISIALGGDKAVKSGAGEQYWTPVTTSKDAANAAAAAVTEEIESEGIILLENANISATEKALPLGNSKRVSVFGKNSVNLVYGGSGSGGGDTTYAKTDLYTALTAAGIEYNPVLKDFYDDNARSGNGRDANSDDLDSGNTVSIATGETPKNKYTADVVASFASDYRDAAIIVISRVGGEGFDLPLTSANGAKHYLALDDDERDMLDMVSKAGFTRVIALLNTLNIMETDFLDTYGVDACLWIGGPGSSGAHAVAKVLTGAVTPSGHTTDTWAKDFTKDPTYRNFSDRGVVNGDRYSVNGKNQLYYFANYEESVYVGYRYYETRDCEEKNKTEPNADWYEENVDYPFGYGLSYTSFDWELTDGSSIDGKAISGDGKYSVTVKVTNTGKYSGKDVVQIYAKLHYDENGLEKPYEVLVGFAKTKLLYPANEANGTDKPNSDTLTIEIDPYDFASYDYRGKSGFTGYVIEAGNDYALLVNSDSHTPKYEIPFTVESDITYAVDPVTENTVENRYTDQSDPAFDSDTMIKDSLLSRADFEGTFPDAPKESDREVTSAFINQIKSTAHNNPEVSDYTMHTQGAEVKYKLKDLLKYDESTETYYVEYKDERWDDVLNALTVDEMAEMFNNGAFKTNYIESINKPQTLESDGPVGWCNFISITDKTWSGNNAYTSQVVMSATWNTELIRKMGECVGEEGLWGAVNTDGRTYSGWYAPGANIHRSPFGGRNFEYFSEDPFLTGMMAAAEITGCQSKGVYCYMKHFALNEQETHRNGSCSWVTEQAMREIYLKPFEIAVKKGGTRAVMSSFNRIGTRWTGGDYRLITEILRNEWGFKGTVICDYNEGNDYMSAKQMAYAGGDLNLCSAKNRMWSKYDANNAGDVTVLRMAAKNILYTVGNSNAMNNVGYKYGMPVWRIIVIVADVATCAALAVWGVFALLGVYRPKKLSAASSSDESEAEKRSDADEAATDDR